MAQSKLQDHISDSAIEKNLYEEWAFKPAYGDLTLDGNFLKLISRLSLPWNAIRQLLPVGEWPFMDELLNAGFAVASREEALHFIGKASKVPYDHPYGSIAVLGMLNVFNQMGDYEIGYDLGMDFLTTEPNVPRAVAAEFITYVGMMYLAMKGTAADKKDTYDLLIQAKPWWQQAPDFSPNRLVWGQTVELVSGTSAEDWAQLYDIGRMGVADAVKMEGGRGELGYRFILIAAKASVFVQPLKEVERLVHEAIRWAEIKHGCTDRVEIKKDINLERPKIIPADLIVPSLGVIAGKDPWAKGEAVLNSMYLPREAIPELREQTKEVIDANFKRGCTDNARAFGRVDYWLAQYEAQRIIAYA